jgi:hypothetical protein
MIEGHKHSQSPVRVKALVTFVLAVIVLVPSMLGFGAKFIEFIHTFTSAPDGIFAIPPLVNYLLASVGFLCLLMWAAANGMFHDLERPKYLMLERERQLEQIQRSACGAPHITSQSTPSRAEEQ